MRYLGGLSGSGTLTANGEEIARATYDFGGYFKERVGVTGSGEIRLAAAVLQRVFGRDDLRLLTDDGRILGLRFSEDKLASDSEFAHVDVTGDLPTDPRGWGH